MTTLLTLNVKQVYNKSPLNAIFLYTK